MPLRTPLTENERQLLLAAKNAPETHPRERERVEMVLLADAGWTNLQIARHLGRGESAVQTHVRAWMVEGLAGMAMGFSPGRTPRITEEYKTKLAEKLGSDRLYSARQLAEELASETGISIGVDHMRTVIKAQGGRYKRTKKSVSHARKPEVFEAKREALDVLKKRCPRGQA